MQSWLAAQKITKPLLVINAALVPLHCTLAYLLVFQTSLGYLGAGVATTVQTLLRCTLTYAFIRRSPRCAHAWRGFELKAAFSGWRGHLRLAGC